MCDDLYSRMIIKRGAGAPTIPVSSDHRNGDWLATDIYEGEFYMDTDTGLVYQRNGSIIQMSDGRKSQLTWKALIVQTSTNAPVLTVIENSLGVTITPAYVGVGAYTLSGFATLLSGSLEIISNNADGDEFYAAIFTTSVLSLSTYVAGVATDGQLSNGASITVTKY